jgi:hypothetical protein
MSDRHRSELKFEIIPSCHLEDDGGSWELENVSGKLIAGGDDILTYRLVYSFPQGKSLGNATLLVKLWPELPEHGRRGGRPEAGFMVAPPSRSVVRKPGNFYVEPTHAVVVVTSTETAEDKVKAIYFSLEDCNFEPTGPPLWRMAVNDSAMLAAFPALNGRWTPMAPVHPDPAYEPDSPIHLQPQHSPRWYSYRNVVEHGTVFKEKVSASRIYDFIAKRYFDSRGLVGSSDLTRFGRAYEAKVVLTHLLASTYKARESGTYPHPRVKDSCGTPDAFLIGEARTFTTLPPWVQEMWNKQPAAARDAIDWTTGILEAKTMKKLDYKRLGPNMKPEHLAQMYWTMLCTNTVWGQYSRACDETKECRVFHVYLMPSVARKLEKCVVRMLTEMIGGCPYLDACDSADNAWLMEWFNSQAIWHAEIVIDAQGEKQRYNTLTWPAEQIALYDQMVAGYDICRLDRTPSADQLASAEPVRKKQRKKPAAKKTAAPKAQPRPAPRAALAPTAVSRVPDAGPIRLTAASVANIMQTQQQSQTIAALVDDLDHTHQVLVECLLNGDYAHALGERVFHSQICRLMEIHGLCKAQEVTKLFQQEPATRPPDE